MALTRYQIPTFEELLKKVKQPKVTVSSDLLDADSASELGYKIPDEWKLGQDITGTSLISPRGNIFKNLKISPEGRIEDFEPVSAEGKPIKLPPVKPEEPPPVEPPKVEPDTRTAQADVESHIGRKLTTFEIYGTRPIPELGNRYFTPALTKEFIEQIPQVEAGEALRSEKGMGYKEFSSIFPTWAEAERAILKENEKLERYTGGAGEDLIRIVRDTTFGERFFEGVREPEPGTFLEKWQQAGETVTAAVQAPLFKVAGIPISAGDIAAIALIAFGIYQVGNAGWNMLLDRVLRKPGDLNRLGRQLTKAGLNKNLNIWEKQSGVKIPPAARKTFIDKYLSEMAAAWERNIASQGANVNIQSLQIASQNTYAQTANVVQREIQTLIPRATQTGALAMGGVPGVSIQSVVAKIVANQPLTLAERQLYANQSQAVEDALKAQVTPTPEVTPTITPPTAPTPIVETVTPAVPEVRAPWQMTKQEYVRPPYTSPAMHKFGVEKALSEGKPVPTEVLAEYPDLKPPAVEVAKPPVEVKPSKEVTRLAEQLKAKLAKEPVTKPPVPKTQVERRTEIQTLLKEPAKNLPVGTTKIVLRKELAQINKSLIPQEKALRQKIMATVKTKSLGITQSRNIFREVGGSRYLTNQELTQLEKVLGAIQRARPIRIRGKKVITPKREALIRSSKKDLVDQGILTEATYKDILKSLKLSTDKYVDSQNFITNSQGSDIIRAMRNMAILNPLGELKFGKPTALKYLTSQIYYAQVLGLKPLTNPLELAKVDFDLANRAMANAVDQKLREVNKAWGVGIREVISAKAKNVPTKGSAALRDLLDKHEEAPASLTDKQKELFNWFRNLNRSIIDGENEVRRAMGVEEISYRQAYVRHIPDVMARNIMEGTHPIPQSLLYWSRRLVGKKIFNPMELHRQLSDDLAKLYSKDLAFATKSMVYTGLKEIHLAQPLRAFTEQMGALSDVMPATTRKWVTDYVNQVIKGQQTEFDESINAIVTESGIGGLIDKTLRPFNRTLGNRPVSKVTRDIGTATIYSVLGLPRPRLLRLMIRNTFQRVQELALHGVMATLKSFLPDPQGLKVLKGESRYLRSYTGIEEMPTELLDKLKKVPLAPYQFTATLNASRGMSAAYHDYLKFITNKKYNNLVGKTGKTWFSEKRDYTEPGGFLYPEEQALILEEMELATRATQYQYIGMGMPEIFRHKTLIPITRLQSWWMNHFTMFHREAFHRFATGETRGGYPLPWSSRVNWLKYLLLGGAILTAMGYGASFGVKVLPHNESPFTQFAVGLAKYVSAGSDWERTQAKRSMYYSWKAIVPGALAYDEFEKLWSGEMPLWQMFWYGSDEEGAPPRIPDWSLPIPTAEKARPRIESLMSMLGGFDQAELDAKIKQATDAGASLARIAEIKAGDYLYDIISMRRDMGDVVQNLSEKDIAKLEPIAGNYVEFKEQDREYSLLSDEEQEQYIKDNPDYTANRLFWGELTTIPFIDIAEAVEAQAKKYNIPLDMIPAFQKTDKGQERIPSDRNLWEAYFTYYDLPGSGGYLSLSQSAVDDGRLPEEYHQIWEVYQRLKTDIAKAAYRKKHRVLTVNLREELRRANPEFDQWLIEQEYNKPLSKKAISRTTRAKMTLPGGFRTPTVSPRRAAPTYPKFPKPRISTGISIRAPSVPGF